MKYIFLLLFLASCTVMPQNGVDKTPANPFLEDALFCNVDADCTCGGRVKDNGMCFLGNKLYSSMYVDLSLDCPDFCTGIAGNLGIKCVDHVCTQEGIIACTMDAKICADGSAVGRIPPDCEFAPCPDEFVGCPEDAKVCDDGTVVVRVGPNCEFAPCPGEKTMCAKDEDCVFDSCCHPAGCVQKSQAPLCDAVACTMVCAPGTLDCGGYCSCVNGECVGMNYFSQ